MQLRDKLMGMNRAIVTVLVLGLVTGACLGWWVHSVTILQSSNIAALQTEGEGKFYAQSSMPFSFMYPKRSNANWQSNNSGFYYSAGIPINDTGLLLDSKGSVIPTLEVRLDEATTSDFVLMDYINIKYPVPASGVLEYRTSLAPYESSDHKFSGYFVTYEVEGMAGYSGEVLVLKSNEGCYSDNPTDCSYLVYAVDNIAGMFSSDEFQKIASSITLTSR